MSLSRRSALLALIIIVPAPSIGAATSFFISPGTVGAVVYSLGKLVLYGVPLLWHLRVDRQPLSWSPPKQGGFATGAALGLVIAAGIWVVWLLWVREAVDPAPLRLAAHENGFDTPLGYLGLATWLCLVNSVLEEYAFRWFVYSRFRTLLGVAASVVAAGLVFTAHHIIVLRAFFDWPLALLCSAGVLTGGLLWSFCYVRFGSIWPGWLSHAIVDLAILGIGWQLIFTGVS